MILIDGSKGEGGGQVLRTSLALSIITGQSFQIENIRAGRKKPGLLRQHLTAVNAAAQISDANVSGNELKSTELIFTPGKVRGGEYKFSVGTAGSAMLVFQTVLMPLLFAQEKSTVVLEGGTHNQKAPPYHYIERVFIPLLRKMGAEIRTNLVRHGFFPAGGGRLEVEIEPVKNLSGLELIERGELVNKNVEAVFAALPAHIARRELETIGKKITCSDDELKVVELPQDQGPGNVLMLTAESENVTELFTGFGEVGVQAETIAKRIAKQYKSYMKVGAPVGEHLADQLLLPLALSTNGGKYRTGRLSLHTKTNIEKIKRFLDVEITAEEVEKNIWEIIVKK